MENRMIWKSVAVLTCGAGLLLAQPQPAKPGAPGQQSPVAKQPTFKSQKEQDAVRAMFVAQDPDSRIKAAQDVLTNFANSEFKVIALYFTAVSYQQKNDPEQTIVYAERTIQADSQNYQALLMLAQTTANRTREFDLDREEKLKIAEGSANQALEILKTAPKPNPALTDEQWEQAKKDLSAQAYEVFASSALARNKVDEAIAQYQKALATATSRDPATMVRLAAAYDKASKYDEAIAVLDKVLATQSLHPAIKQIAQSQRNRAVQAKSGGVQPAAPAKP